MIFPRVRFIFSKNNDPFILSYKKGMGVLLFGYRKFGVVIDFKGRFSSMLDVMRRNETPQTTQYRASVSYCSVCGKPLMVSHGQVVKYHKECRNYR